MIAGSAAEFRDALPEKGRLLGLDIGTTLHGVALCDARWTIATPTAPIAKSKFVRERAALQGLIAAEAIAGIVVGLPRNLDGSDSPRTQSVRAYARNLESFGMPILLWDERWSTQAVERAMIAADLSRAKRAARVDSAAAAYILQGALDALAGQPLT